MISRDWPMTWLNHHVTAFIINSISKLLFKSWTSSAIAKIVANTVWKSTSIWEIIGQMGFRSDAADVSPEVTAECNIPLVRLMESVPSCDSSFCLIGCYSFRIFHFVQAIHFGSIGDFHLFVQTRLKWGKFNCFTLLGFWRFFDDSRGISNQTLGKFLGRFFVD